MRALATCWSGHTRVSLCSALAALGLLAAAGCPLLPPAQQPTSDTGGSAGSAPDAATLYRTNGCASCHGEDGCGDEGPALVGVSFEALDAFLRSENTPHLGGPYPDLSDAEITALVDFLGQLDGCAEVSLSAAPLPPEYRDFSVIGVHDPASNEYRPDCVTCHGDRLSEQAPSGEIRAAHSVMTKILGLARCHTCHGQGVDIIYRGDARLRADRFGGPTSCAARLCHGASGVLPFYRIDEE